MAFGERQHDSERIVGKGATQSPLPEMVLYFGGKSRVADMVWDRLGDCDNFIEPFAGSVAVLLRRPTEGRIETVNDWNSYVANFWRATKHDPAGVAEYAAHPVNEVDLHARHRWLVLSQESAEFRQRMRREPDYYDVKTAGWWVWGCSCWIGGGWCTANEEHEPIKPNQRPRLVADGLNTAAAKRPALGGNPGNGGTVYGAGVHSKGENLPEKRTRLAAFDQAGTGVHGKMPNYDSRGVLAPTQWEQQPNSRERDAAAPRPSGRRPGLGQDGWGANAGRPQLADAYSRGRGVNSNDSAGTCEQRRTWLSDWFQRLQDRLRTVRVCCGDWLRVCDSPSVTTRLGLTGIFLDPPYRTTLKDGSSNRDAALYASDRDNNADALVDRVIKYCVERGADPRMRIAVCGYEGEGYEVLEPLGWTVEAWKAQGGYGNRKPEGEENENRSRERIWFSPHCVAAAATLFDGMAS